MKRTPLRTKAPADRSTEPGYREWKAPGFGRCGVCSRPGLLVRHHVVLEQHVRAAGGDPWDLRNALQIGAGQVCACHRQHHHGARIPVSLLPAAAIEFAIDVLGQNRAEQYLERYYAPR